MMLFYQVVAPPLLTNETAALLFDGPTLFNASKAARDAARIADMFDVLAHSQHAGVHGHVTPVRHEASHAGSADARRRHPRGRGA